MQAIKNALHSSSSREDGTTSQSHGNTYNGNETTVGNANVGSSTGDSSHSRLSNDANQSSYNNQNPISSSNQVSGSTPTNSSATRSTGLTGSSTSSDYNTGSGRSTANTSGLDHTTGHDHSAAAKFDPTDRNVTHDHKHLNEVVHQDHRHVEVEEVERQRNIDRNIHHVQHHVQPVVDKQVKDEVYHENVVPTTNINERHSSTNEDKKLFSGLASQYRDEETHRGKERTVVDLGEKVHENVHHHVHHVTQPVIEQEVIDREKIHTVIPIHHTTHEAPIIHKSSTHEPVSMADFQAGGGKLHSGITGSNAGVLNTGECGRTVEGEGLNLIEKLHLGSTPSSFGAGRTSRRQGRKAGRSGSMSSVSSSDEEGGSRRQKREKRYQSKDGDMHKSKVGAKLDDVNERGNSRTNQTSSNQY